MFFKNKEIQKRKPDEISIIISSDDNYAPYVGVTVQSIIENSSKNLPYTIYILDGDISKTNKKLLNKIQTHNVKITYIDMKSYMKNINLSLFYIYNHFKLASYFRFFIPIIFKNFEKIIYCDCDGIFKDNIAKLNDIDMKEYWIGAVKDTYVNILLKNPEMFPYFKNTLNLQNPENYFQAGLLIMNIKELIKHNFTNKCIKTLKILQKPKYVDQCILNSVCQNNVLFLDNSWNVESPVIRDINKNRDTLPEEFCETYLNAYNNPKFIHYCGPKKPWNTQKTYNSEKFWEYARRTPFFSKTKKSGKKKLKPVPIYQKIFSVKNSTDKRHKVLTIMGVKIKFRKKQEKTK
ncbi:glycosyltransferase family 8 protein [bacterium]|nr:glycosyltransferase family 8 protein [bacterium]